MPADLIALAAPVVFIAYVVFGMTGFGAAMVAVPILAQFMPLSVAVPLVVLFDLACTALVGGRNWRQVSRVELARLFPWMLLGIFLGVTLLRNAGARWPLIVLGCFVLTVCARGLKGGRAPARNRCPRPGRCRSACSVACSARCSARAGRSTPSTCRAASPRWTRSAPRFRSSSWPAASSAPGPRRCRAVYAAGHAEERCLAAARGAGRAVRRIAPQDAGGAGPLAAVHLPAAGGGWRGAIYRGWMSPA